MKTKMMRELKVVYYAVHDNFLTEYLMELEHIGIESMWLIYRAQHTATGAIYHSPSADSYPTTLHSIQAADEVIKRHPGAGIQMISIACRKRHI